ncbi:MAG TPA: TonB family protein, partial [Kofleriaceae bacterium]|nr:TonB family protein [Kofleriaceae bacterium]
TQIFPGKDTRKRMIDRGVTSVEGTVGLCVAATGSVKEAKMMESTGYGDYDKELLAAVRGWTYPPTPADDTSAPVCSEVEFTYTLE